MRSARSWLALSALLASTLLAMEIRYGSGEAGVVPALQEVFHGAGDERLAISPLVFNLVATISPAFVSHMGLTSVLRGGIYEELVRFGDAFRWSRHYIVRAFLAASLVWVLLLGAHMLFQQAFSRGRGADWNSVPLGEAGAGAICVFFLSAGIVQSSVYSLLFFVATMATRRIDAGFWVLGVLLILATPMFYRVGVFPSALNSMSSTIRADATICVQIGVLAVWWGLLMAALYALLRRGEFHFH